MTHTLPRSKAIAVAERVFLVLLEAWYRNALRGVIVAGRGRKSSATFGTLARADCYPNQQYAPRQNPLQRRTINGTCSIEAMVLKRLPAFFYALPSGREPVREWLKGLPGEDRKIVGEDI